MQPPVALTGGRSSQGGVFGGPCSGGKGRQVVAVILQEVAATHPQVNGFCLRLIPGPIMPC